VHDLASAGVLLQVARGVLDATSVDQYAAVGRTGTQAWAESTAWGAVALLSGADAPWMGRTQTGRLRRRLGDLTPERLVERARGRAVCVRYAAHRSVLPRVAAQVISPPREALGLAATYDGTVDGYVDPGTHERVVRTYALRPDPDGLVTVRVTGMDLDVVRDLARSRGLAALDLAASLDSREREVGLSVLHEAMSHVRR
jgi:hypothetical protein